MMDGNWKSRKGVPGEESHFLGIKRRAYPAIGIFLGIGRIE